MNTITVAGAVMINNQQEVLCALRSSKMSMPNVWEFPGGKIEPGETPEEALVREIKEELNCTINVLHLIENVVHVYPHIKVRLLTYEARIIEGTPTASEHACLTWKKVDELIELNWAPADIPTVKRLVDHSK